jgi:hypothetical protein
MKRQSRHRGSKTAALDKSTATSQFCSQRTNESISRTDGIDSGGDFDGDQAGGTSLLPQC